MSWSRASSTRLLPRKNRSNPMQTLSSTPEHLLRQLEWSVIRRLDGLLQGDYRTFMRGAGLDLADLREYQHGDDVRHIDWNVTARLQTPHVREYIEDSEITAWFLLDLSASVDFGSADVRKRTVAAQFVALLARLMTRRGNRVGAVIYGTGVDEVIHPGASRRRVLHRFAQAPPAHERQRRFRQPGQPNAFTFAPCNEGVDMKFLWPEMFWALLALPMLVGLYLWMLKRKKKLTVRYANLGMVKQAIGGGIHWKRHVPPALFLLAIALLLLAGTRPMTVVTLPSQQQTIILAMDVSGSMRAADVQPNRLVAAQNAAKAFLEDLPAHVRVGID